MKTEARQPSFCNRRSAFARRIACAALTFVALATMAPAQAQSAHKPSVAPVNPAFANYRPAYHGKSVAKTHSLGYIPGPINFSHNKGKAITRGVHPLALPVSYDMRDYNRLTPVKDQGFEGACWAFATYGSAESILRPGETCDFSENHLKNTHGFDLTPSQGGNREMATAYLTRGSGAVRESDDPYHAGSTYSPPALPIQKYIQNVYFLPDRSGYSDNANIKNAVMTYGAVMTSLRWEEGSFTGATNSYYYDGEQPSNHAVCIVGWDDTYAASNFAFPAPGNGAFIVRNSWGADWGDGGYFYISYYDSNVGKDNTIFAKAVTPATYRRIYQYDPLGWTNSLGFGSSTASFANIFTAAAGESLSAVGFYAASPNASYTISIYRNPDNGPIHSNGPVSVKSGTLALPGYNTIPLDTKVALTSGQRFSVVVRLTTPGTNYPIPMEAPIANYTSHATATVGQSYVSYDGASWSDLTRLDGLANTNVCLKALTSGVGASSMTLANLTAAPGQTVNLTATLTNGTTGLSGKPISFTINGYAIGTATTNANGVAVRSITFSPKTPVGIYNMIAQFAGEGEASAASTTAKLTIAKPATKTAAANATVKRGQAVLLQANLKRASDNTPVAGKTLVFRINGYVYGSAVTNTYGVATFRLSVSSEVWPGLYNFTAQFAGDAQMTDSVGTASLLVLP